MSYLPNISLNKLIQTAIVVHKHSVVNTLEGHYFPANLQSKKIHSYKYVVIVIIVTTRVVRTYRIASPAAIYL